MASGLQRLKYAICVAGESVPSGQSPPRQAPFSFQKAFDKVLKKVGAKERPGCTSGNSTEENGYATPDETLEPHPSSRRSSVSSQTTQTEPAALALSDSSKILDDRHNVMPTWQV